MFNVHYSFSSKISVCKKERKKKRKEKRRKEGRTVRLMREREKGRRVSGD